MSVYSYLVQVEGIANRRKQLGGYLQVSTEEYVVLAQIVEEDKRRSLTFIVRMGGREGGPSHERCHIG